MRRLILSLLVVESATSLVRAGRTPAPRDEMLITTTALAEQLGDSKLVLIHVGGQSEHQKRHIFTLLHAGLGERTRWLDGGMPQWLRERRATTDLVPSVKPGTLSALHEQPNVVDASYVKKHLGRAGFSVIDGRSSSFYDGIQTGNDHRGAQRTGHIAGAKSVPFGAPYDNTNHLRPNRELEALFANAGVAPTDTIIGYCHIGQQATAMLFAARAIGHPVLLYDGSFEDWSKRDPAAFPVENPSARRKP